MGFKNIHTKFQFNEMSSSVTILHHFEYMLVYTFSTLFLNVFSREKSI